MENTSLLLAPPTTKRETESLLGLSGYWKHTRALLSLLTDLKPISVCGPKEEHFSSNPGSSTSSSAIRPYWPSDGNEAQRVNQQIHAMKSHWQTPPRESQQGPLGVFRATNTFFITPRFSFGNNSSAFCLVENKHLATGNYKTWAAH